MTEKKNKSKEMRKGHLKLTDEFTGTSSSSLLIIFFPLLYYDDYNHEFCNDYDDDDDDHKIETEETKNFIYLLYI